MGRLVPALLTWWLTPRDSVEERVEERRRAFAHGLKTYLILTLLMLFFAWDAAVFYCVWLLVALTHGGYQYCYAFAASMDRPSLYYQTAELLLFLDILSHVALAGFSSIGWWALAPLALAWFFFGRTVGSLAAAKELRSISSLVRREHPSDTMDRQAQITRRIFRERLELLAE